MVNDQKITENFQNFEKNSIINNSGTENLGLNVFILLMIMLQLNCLLYDNEITSLIDIYFPRISFTPSNPFRHPV